MDLLRFNGASFSGSSSQQDLLHIQPQRQETLLSEKYQDYITYLSKYKHRIVPRPFKSVKVRNEATGQKTER